MTVFTRGEQIGGGIGTTNRSYTEIQE